MNSSEATVRDIGDIKRLCAMLESKINKNTALLESLIKLIEGTK